MENKSGTIRSFDVHAGQMSSGVSQVSTGRSRKTQLSFRATIKSSVFVNAAFFGFTYFSSFSSASETTTPADLILFTSLRPLPTTPRDPAYTIRLFLPIPPLPQLGFFLCDDHLAALTSTSCYFPPALTDAVGIIRSFCRFFFNSCIRSLSDDFTCNPRPCC